MVDGRALTIVATEPAGPIAQFRDMRARWIDGRPLTATQVEILCDGFGEFLDAIDEGECASLDRAFGLRKRGGVSPHREEGLRTRDELLRRLWSECGQFSGHPAFAAAKLMYLSAKRYEDHRWKREFGSPAPCDEPLRTWWKILKSGQTIPSAKRITQILQF
jgi:hypothetical protein